MIQPPLLHIPHNSTIIIGFSGGPDSLYLFLRLKEIEKSHNLTLIAAHLDHEWRAESAQELLWCKEVCEKFSVKFIGKKASLVSTIKLPNGSKEEFARYMRRSFFEEIAKGYQNALIALAHHKDDQLENFFIRLSRGTSLQGLSGMKQRDGLYIRPLLHIAKEDILQYLHDKKITYLEDPTNQSLSFLRNRIRQQLTPILPSIDPRLSAHILKTMEHIASVNDFLDKTTLETMETITISHNPTKLNRSKFLTLHSVMQHRILLFLLIKVNARFTPSKALFSEIIAFLKRTKSKEHTIHTTYKIVKDNISFYIT